MNERLTEGQRRRMVSQEMEERLTAEKNRK